jgi:hypothetical protein
MPQAPDPWKGYWMVRQTLTRSGCVLFNCVTIARGAGPRSAPPLPEGAAPHDRGRECGMHDSSSGGIMAEPHNHRPTPERYETTDPRNPPNSVTSESVRRAAFRSYLGPLVVFFLIAGMALIYWANRGPVAPGPEDRLQIGTTGSPDDRVDVVGERGNRDDTPGGNNPDPRHDSTASEVEYRSGNPDQPAFPGVHPELDLTGLATLEGEPKNVVGRRIDVRNVSVADVQDSLHFWIQDGNHKTEVMAPRGGSAVRKGSRVNVSGVVEEDGRGGVRIRADRVNVN